MSPILTPATAGSGGRIPKRCNGLAVPSLRISLPSAGALLPPLLAAVVTLNCKKPNWSAVTAIPLAPPKPASTAV